MLRYNAFGSSAPMRLTYNSHASIRMESDLGSLVTDPWFYEPIYGGMMWQFPRSNVALTSYTEADTVIISHSHPDHFCIKSLGHFSGSPCHFLLPKLGHSRVITEYLDSLGCNYTEVGHKEHINVPGYRVQFFHAGNNCDSAQVIQSVNCGRVIFNMNDCFLSDEDLSEIGRVNKVDHAMVFFMGIGPYPGSFEMSMENKLAVVEAKKLHSYRRALKTLATINVTTFTAYSNDMTWLRRRDLAELYSFGKHEFYSFIEASLPGRSCDSAKNCTPISLESGDVYDFSVGKVQALSMVASCTKDGALAGDLDLLHQKSREKIQTIELAESSFELRTQDIPAELEELVAILNRISNSESLKDFSVVANIKERHKLVFNSRINQWQYSGLDNDLIDADLGLCLDENLWACIQTGFYTSEDLMNCRFAISRSGEYTREEEIFWRGFSMLRQHYSSFSILDFQMSALSQHALEN